MSKVSMKYHYHIHDNDDGSKTIKIFDTVDGEPIEFEAINGWLILAGDMAFDYNDVEPCTCILADCIEYAKEELLEWDVNEVIADAIIKDLAPWFEQYALTEEEYARKRIADFERWIFNRQKSIEENKKYIRQKESEVRIFTAKAEKYINALKEENVEFQADIHKYAETIKALKKTLK